MASVSPSGNNWWYQTNNYKGEGQRSAKTLMSLFGDSAVARH